MNGALIFAFNNETIDYVSMAAWSARRIHQHLDIPVCLVTDTNVSNTIFDCIIKVVPTAGNRRYFGDYHKDVNWYNSDRMDAYELSPWDTTLVLDADYVVASDRLATLFKVDQDFLAHRWAHDVTFGNDFAGLNYFGRYHMPMWWATVMMFRRGHQAKMIFDSMTMVKNNWAHYLHLYNNSHATYRNDHALTIALGLVNGHLLNHPNIPWSLSSIMPDYQIQQIDQDSFRVDYQGVDSKPRWIELKGQDFHAMGTKNIGEIVASAG